MQENQKKTALLSVYDKKGIVEFAKQLVGLGWDILASGGTAKALLGAGISVRDVADLVGGGAILGHRVVTLSREVHAGLLARPEDQEELDKLGVPRIDLVCVDMYPLKQEVESETATMESVIEKTDIGGPTMLRSAAKGRRIVICDSADRQTVIDWLKEGELNKDEFISRLVAKVEMTVSQYCLTSAGFHGHREVDGFIGWQARKCSYGENPWQTPAGLFTFDSADQLTLDKFNQVEGAEPSFMNLADIDRLVQTITHIAAVYDFNFGEVPPIAVGCKHGNPCGAAVMESQEQAVKKMVIGDIRAIFGGAVIFNFGVRHLEAGYLLHSESENRRLIDVVVAPEFSASALEILKRKNGRCKIFTNSALYEIGKKSLDAKMRFRQVRGGFLRQPNYTFVLDLQDKCIAKFGSEMTEQEKSDSVLAWAIGSTSNSNTVDLVKNGQLIGNGVGGQDRVGAAELAIFKAKKSGHEIAGAVAYSDSFFPFDDGPRTLIDVGVKVIITSSGSVNDEDTIKLCQEQGVKLLMIPDKIGRGFFGH